MSIKRARDVLNKRKCDKSVLLDLPNHRNFVKYLTGLDCLYETEKAIAEAIKKLDVDILMCSVPYQPQNPEFNENDPNLYSIDPTAWRNHESTSDNIFDHDPLEIRPFYNVSDEELLKNHIEEDARNRRIVGGTALTHGFTFTTCIHYSAEDLDYEEFLCACYEEPEKIEILFDKYEALSHRLITSWANSNIEMMLCHDDIANAKNLTFSPDFLRKHLFPRYKRLFAPIKEKNIPLLAITDGNFLEVAPDYVEAGADGFYVDRPSLDLVELIKICGEDKIYFTGPTPEIVTNGSVGDVVKEMDMLKEISKSVNGLMFHIPGGWVHNMPVENVKAYYECQNRI